MATDVSRVRVAVSGAVFKGPTSMTAPSGTSGAPTGATDLGAISDDGVEIEMPDAGDSTPIKQWDGSTVRTIRSPSEDSPTWTFTMLETSVESVETYFGVTVTQTVTEGSFEYTVTNRGHDSYVVDYIDGAELMRDYIPYGVVTEVDSQTLANSDAVRYTVTVAGELSPTAGFNFKRWATALKSA
jgi:hypothetical protein